MLSSIASKSEKNPIHKVMKWSSMQLAQACGPIYIAVPFFWAGPRYSAFRLRMLFVG